MAVGSQVPITGHGFNTKSGREALVSTRTIAFQGRSGVRWLASQRTAAGLRPALFNLPFTPF
jgi:hypothetical protein